VELRLVGNERVFVEELDAINGVFNSFGVARGECVEQVKLGVPYWVKTELPASERYGTS
jgi:hypothetical protein